MFAYPVRAAGQA